MDHDINDAGAFHATRMSQQNDWRPITEAPRNGTVIEIRCTYGVAPWFGLYRWITPPGRWAKVGDDNFGFSEGPSFSWRPYHGVATEYVDPTGGAQDSMAYWRGAVAAKYGLPLNAFEEITEQNFSQSAPETAPSRLPRSLGLFQRFLLWMRSP